MAQKTIEPRETQSESKDIYTLYSRNLNTFFGEIEKMIPQYRQAMSNLQHTYATYCKDVMKSAISLTHEIASNAGTNIGVTQPIAKMVNTASDGLIKAQDLQIKAVLSTIDAANQSLNTYANIAKNIAEINQNMLHTGISMSSS